MPRYRANLELVVLAHDVERARQFLDYLGRVIQDSHPYTVPSYAVGTVLPTAPDRSGEARNANR